MTLTIEATRQNSKEFDAYEGHKDNCAYGKDGTGKKDKAGNRVEMSLKIGEWLWYWLESGHFDQRGTFAGGYVMSRRNDIGHYERGNVFIQSHSDNIRQGNLGVPKTQTQKNALSAAMKGIKRPTIACRHCGLEAVVANINRWHNDNCRKRTV